MLFALTSPASVLIPDLKNDTRKWAKYVHLFSEIVKFSLEILP